MLDRELVSDIYALGFEHGQKSNTDEPVDKSNADVSDKNALRPSTFYVDLGGDLWYVNEKKQTYMWDCDARSWNNGDIFSLYVIDDLDVVDLPTSS